MEQLIQNKDADLVKIVTGIRRCGKSSILDLFHQYLVDGGVCEDNIIHMNLESLKYRKLTDYLSLYDYVSELIVKNGRTYLIFDELQMGGTLGESYRVILAGFRCGYLYNYTFLMKGAMHAV